MRFLLFVLFCAALKVNAQFTHPGGLHKKSDLERMRYMVEARIDPWHASYLKLKDYPAASANYKVRGDSSWTVVNRDPCNRCGEFLSDATAAYLNAIMWSITGDARHAAKAVEIFNAWKNLTEFTGGGTEALNAGLFAWKMVEAAEIIKSTYSGWSASDLKGFQDMLVYPGYSNIGIPATVNASNGTFYWRIFNGDPGRHGNQDLIAWRAMITMGVFLDNRLMYERALRYFQGQPARPDDLPYTPGPGVQGAQIADNPYFTTFSATRGNSVADYGYNGVLQHYIWENGQSQESSRDQHHALFGLGAAAGIAEVAWNQGHPVWNFLDNRLLKGFEFAARYNASFVQAFPDQPAPWEPENVILRADRTGRWLSKAINPYFDGDFETLSRGDFPGNRPVFEQALAHFRGRMGYAAEAVWTERARDVAFAKSGLETNGFNLDHPGWGALFFRRPPLSSGDPVSGFADGLPVFGMPVLPTVCEAENYDDFPGGGLGRSYHDSTPVNSGGQYRPDDGVDIEAGPAGGYGITDLRTGEWLNYTVHVPAAGDYVVSLRYAASGPGGKIKFAFAGEDKTGEVAVPFGAPYSAGGSDWKDFVVDTVPLAAGVQSMRLVVAGTGDRYKLDKIVVTRTGNLSLADRRARPRAVRSGNGLFKLPRPEGFAGPVLIRVFGMHGNAMGTFLAAGETLSLDLRGFPKETYPVRLQEGANPPADFLLTH